METKLALGLTDKKFKYHSAALHTSADVQAKLREKNT